MNRKIYGLVPAAGLSRRMGQSKQLLPFGDRTVLQSVVKALLAAHLTDVVVVLGHHAEVVRASLADYPVRCCVNEAYREGMFSSLLCGLRHLPDGADAALIALGDQPHIETRVAKEVIAAYCAGDSGIVIPTWSGKRGHPALVDLKRYRAAIFALSGNEGLKPVMRGYPEDTLEVPVDDEGILRDLDTPEDYRAELERRRDEQ